MTLDLENKKFKYQKNFLEYLTNLEKFSACHTPLSRNLKDPKLNRIETYQSSYLGRITSNLADSLFEECTNLFGRELVSRVLADYFKCNPPTATNLIDAPDNLPTYLRSCSESKEALLFADLAEMCLKRWAILTGPDPKVSPACTDSNFSELFLLPSANFIKPSAHHDLYCCWNQSQSQSQSQKYDIPEEIFNHSVGVLLAKTSPTQFFALAVSSEVYPFIEAMVQGTSLEEALETLAQSASEDPQQAIASTLQNLISTLAGSNIFTNVQPS
jgi:hypothetical protein